MSSKIEDVLKVSIAAYDETIHERQTEFFLTMHLGIETLFRKTLGGPWTEKNKGLAYTRIIISNIPKHLQWISILVPTGKVITFEFDIKETYNQVLGKYYGYDDCCIAMLATPEYTEHRSLKPVPGSGFFPCDCCCEKPLEQLVNEITARRKSKIPFPKSRYAVDAIDIIFKIINGDMVVTPKGAA